MNANMRRPWLMLLLLALAGCAAHPAAPAEEKASRKRRLLKGPEEFREVRVDRVKR